jgi:hypothetical protein
MPCKQCSGGKWRIGKGPCKYTSKEKCQAAYKAYLAKVNQKLGPKSHTKGVDSAEDED